MLTFALLWAVGVCVVGNIKAGIHLQIMSDTFDFSAHPPLCSEHFEPRPTELEIIRFTLVKAMVVITHCMYIHH